MHRLACEQLHYVTQLISGSKITFGDHFLSRSEILSDPRPDRNLPRDHCSKEHHLPLGADQVRNALTHACGFERPGDSIMLQ